jgi:hypothetical protein
MRRARWFVAVIAAVMVPAAAAGCADPQPPEHSATVPSIDNARDVRAADPCALPTAEQLGRLGIDVEGVAVSAPEGRRCEWRATRDGGPELGITVYADGGGLTTLAENSEPTTSRVRLAGYPALETFTGTGEFCQYDVGVAPTQVLMASLQDGTPDSCTALQSVLPDMLSTLPALDT